MASLKKLSRRGGCMVKKLIFICFVAITTSGCSDINSQEVESVRNCFSAYRKAILDQDGVAAAALIDGETRKYYGKMRSLALFGDANDVRKVSTIDRVNVLMIRHLIPPAELAEMTPESLFVHAVDEGWIGRESVVNNELGAIKISGSLASGVHIAAGNQTPFKWTFRKEDGSWKIDITAILPIADQAFKQIIKESEVAEDDFLFGILESISGKKVSDQIWEPLFVPGVQ